VTCVTLPSVEPTRALPPLSGSLTLAVDEGFGLRSASARRAHPVTHLSYLDQHRRLPLCLLISAHPLLPTTPPLPYLVHHHRTHARTHKSITVPSLLQPARALLSPPTCATKSPPARRRLPPKTPHTQPLGAQQRLSPQVVPKQHHHPRTPLRPSAAVTLRPARTTHTSLDTLSRRFINNPTPTFARRPHSVTAVTTTF
jgi:hypothetical protein